MGEGVSLATVIALAGLGLGILGLLGPALVYLGLRLGALQKSTDGAHERIDRLEALLERGFDRLGERMEKSIKEAWLHCPLAHMKEEHDD